MTETMTAAEFRAAGKPKRNKFGARKVKHDGYTFDLSAEFRRYCTLKRMLRAGLISNLVVHPRYDLTINGRPILTRSERYQNGRAAHFTPDFAYMKVGAGIIVEDVKAEPTITEAFLLRRAVFEALYYPVQCEIILG